MAINNNMGARFLESLTLVIHLNTDAISILALNLYRLFEDIIKIMNPLCLLLNYIPTSCIINKNYIFENFCNDMKR
jgi:hypothetical protein